MPEKKRRHSTSIESSSETPTSSQMSTAPSMMSVKSDKSMFEPLGFKSSQLGASGSAAPSMVSVKSDKSMFEPLGFENEAQRHEGHSIQNLLQVENWAVCHCDKLTETEEQNKDYHCSL